MFKFFRALLIHQLCKIFALLKKSSSRYSLCFIILEIIFEFGEMATSPCNKFFSWVSVVDPHGSSFQKQHIKYQKDLSFCNFQYVEGVQNDTAIAMICPILYFASEKRNIVGAAINFGFYIIIKNFSTFFHPS